MEIKYSPEVREMLKLTGMTDAEINNEEVRLSQHEKDILSGKIQSDEPSRNLQEKFDSAFLERLGS